MSKPNLSTTLISNAGTMLSLLTAGALMSTAMAADLTVTVSSVQKSEGTIMLAIYDSEGNYRKTERIAAREAAKKGDMTFNFPDLGVGTYAVMAFHDCNSNSELDTNLLGIPKEPWGGSLQGKSVFGAPGWADVKFELTDIGKSIDIKLN